MKKIRYIFLILAVNGFILSKKSSCIYTDSYHGKNLSEISRMEPRLGKALSRSYWDIIFIKISSIFTSHVSSKKIQEMKQDLEAIDQMVKILYEIIQKNNGYCNGIAQRSSALGYLILYMLASSVKMLDYKNEQRTIKAYEELLEIRNNLITIIQKYDKN